MPVRDEQTDDGFWRALGDRALHPVRVEIIEALRWIDRPVQTGDLLGVVNWRRPGGLRVEHHLRQLTRLGIVKRGQGSGMTHSYRLTKRPRS